MTSVSAWCNLLANGSFESNAASGTLYNLTNFQAMFVINGFAAYGPSEGVDLMENSTNSFGLDTTDGAYKLGISSGEYIGLWAPGGITTGTNYRIRFMAHAESSLTGRGPIMIGVGSSSHVGFDVFSSGPTLQTGSWTSYEGTFISPTDGDFLSIRTDGATWAHIDKFELTTVVPEPASMAVLGLGIVALVRKRRS